MKRIYILLATILMSGITFAQNTDNSQKTFESMNFKINFPGGTPDMHVESGKNKYGTSNTISYIFENTDGNMFIVNESDYSEDEINNTNSDTLLDNTMSVLLNQFTLEKTIFQRIVINGYPGVYMLAENTGKAYFATANYLIDTKLYQLIIFSKNEMPEYQTVNDFIFSFKLNNQPVYDYFESDEGFRINFFGKTPKKTDNIIDKNLDSQHTSVIFSYKKSKQLKYTLDVMKFTNEYFKTQKGDIFLDKHRDNFLKKSETEVTEDRMFVFKGQYWGRYSKTSDKHGKYVFYAQYIIGTKYYQMAVIKKNKPLTKEEIKEYIYSFDLK